MSEDAGRKKILIKSSGNNPKDSPFGRVKNERGHKNIDWRRKNLIIELFSEVGGVGQSILGNLEDRLQQKTQEIQISAEKKIERCDTPEKIASRRKGFQKGKKKGLSPERVRTGGDVGQVGVTTISTNSEESPWKRGWEKRTKEFSVQDIPYRAQ